jgi:hypothetical protein
MGTDATTPAKVIVAETGALAALTFYAHNYTNLMFSGLGAGNKRIVLGNKPFECRPSRLSPRALIRESWYETPTAELTPS